MTAGTDFKPGYAVPPGETVLDFLERDGMTQTDLARRLGVSLKHVHQVVKGAVGISPELAVGLDRVLGPSVEFWVTRDAHFQADRARLNDEQVLVEHLDWLADFPVKELQSRGYLPEAVSGTRLVRELLRFFAIANPKQYAPVAVPFRKSLKVQSSPDALSAWVRAGEIQAAKVKCKPFDANAFRDVLLEVRALTRLEAEEWAPKLADLCADVGVAVVVVPTFKKARANGAAKWVTPRKAVIQLSRRYVWEDIFWFSFFHEAGHLLLHRKKDVFIDDGAPAQEVIEDEANRFASRMLIPAQYERRLTSLQLRDVDAFADQIGIAPGCVIGRLQHEKLLPHNVGQDRRRKLPTWLGEGA